MQSDSENPIQTIDDLAQQIVSIRKKPLLVLYHHDGSTIEPDNHKIVYNELRQHVESVDEMDVLLHGNGGNGDVSYQIASVIRDISENVEILVQEKAISGHTLISLVGNKILFGAFARLSAVDTFQDGDGVGDIPCFFITTELFIHYIKHAKETIEADLEDEYTKIEEVMMSKYLAEYGVEQISYMFRTNELAVFYGCELLKNMIPDADKSRTIMKALTYQYPSHTFVLDYHFANKLGLVAEKMPIKLSDVSKELIEALQEAANTGDICDDIEDDEHNKDNRAPFVKYYPLTETIS